MGLDEIDEIVSKYNCCPVKTIVLICFEIWRILLFHYLFTAKLSGMNENRESCDIPENKRTPEGIYSSVLSVSNVLQVPSSDPDVFNFAAHTLASGTVVLISVRLAGKGAKITVNCEKMVIGTMLLKDLKRALSSASI